MASSGLTVDDLSEVVLRPPDRQVEDWKPRLPSRTGAVRRPGTSYTLPQLEQVRRNAIFVDDDVYANMVCALEYISCSGKYRHNSIENNYCGGKGLW